MIHLPVLDIVPIAINLVNIFPTHLASIHVNELELYLWALIV